MARPLPKPWDDMGRRERREWMRGNAKSALGSLFRSAKTENPPLPRSPAPSTHISTFASISATPIPVRSKNQAQATTSSVERAQLEVLQQPQTIEKASRTGLEPARINLELQDVERFEMLRCGIERSTRMESLEAHDSENYARRHYSVDHGSMRSEILINHNERVTEGSDTVPPWYIERPRVLQKTDSEYLCANCRHIDLDFIFRHSEPQQYVDPNDYIVLGSLRTMFAKPECGLCHLVTSMVFSKYENATAEDSYQAGNTPRPELETKYFLSPAAFTNDQTGPSFQVFLRQDIFDVVNEDSDEVKTAKHIAQGSSNLGIRLISDSPRGGRAIPDGHLDFAWIKGTLRLCELSSEHPSPRFSNPARVIDVLEMKIVTIEPTTRYVTLSYAWGGVKPKKLVLRDTINQYQQRNSLEPALKQLPTTIQDAFLLVREIGERYLWVDFMCILQDDPKDFENQINQMSTIYRHSLFTVHAAAGQDADYGLPGVRQGTRRTRQIVKKVGDLTVANILLPENEDTQSQRESEWRRRAWTYQERVLSQRHLFVTDEAMHFNCLHVNSPEDEWCWHSKQPNPRMMSTGGTVFFEGQDLQCEPYLTDQNKTDLDTYAMMVSEYTQRRLTFQTDAAVAFTGILQEFEGRLGRGFVYALPEAELDAALLWTPVGCGNTRRHPHDGCTFPSWSWLGWTGHAAYPWLLERTCLVSTVNSPLVWRNADDRSPNYRWFTLEDTCLPQSSDRARILAKLRARDAAHLGLWKSCQLLRRRLEGEHQDFASLRWPNGIRPRYQYMAHASSRLVFSTLSASFVVANRPFQRKRLYNMKHTVIRLAVFDSSNYIAGYIDIPDPRILPTWTANFSGRREFIALSRSTINPDQVGEEEPDPLDEGFRFTLRRGEPTVTKSSMANYIDELGHFDTRIYDAERPWCLFNVMMIEWKEGVAYRIAIGRIHVDAFLCAKPVNKTIKLE